MPAVSKHQFKFMGAVASGKVKKAGLSPEQAKEYISGQTNYHKLPSRSPTSKKAKVKKMKHGQY